MSAREQSERALDELHEISRLSEGSDREKMRTRIEAAYLDIIRKYPDSLLAPECYRKLMLFYLREYAPPEMHKAELLHSEFVSRYPESNERNLIDDILGEVYYSNAEWEKLMKLYAPAIRRFIVTRELKSPVGMLMFSEAKFHLGDKDEARKGYNIVIFYFPQSIGSSLAKKRLAEIVGKPCETNEMRNGDKTREGPSPGALQEAETEGIPPVAQEGPAPQDQSDEVKTGGGTYSVQAGFFESEGSANELSEELKKKGYDAFVQKQMNADGKIFFRVLIGRFHDKTEAVEYAAMVLRKEGLKAIGVGTLEAPVPATPELQQIAPPEEPPVSNAGEKGNYSVQVGFFRNEKNAASLSEKLKEKGYDAFVQRYVNKNKKIFFRVMVGRFHDKTGAVEQAEIIQRREGMKSIIYQHKE
ncbi:MAG: SPOR domain-containing protein [Nitrospirota bacterium]|nr:SPOR domain-containing protein [Nitrospirota bacterium]